MNILLSTIGRRSYLARYFRETSYSSVKVLGTTDRHNAENEFTSGLFACDKGFLVPSVLHEDYINMLLGLCERENVRMITSLYDLDSQEISKHLDKFRNIGVTAFISSQQVNKICFDKYETYLFLKENNFKTPATFLSIDDYKRSGLDYPVMVKPRCGFASIGLHIVVNDEELKSYFKPDIHVIQEFIKAQEHSFDIFCDLDGRVLSCVVKRKIRMRAGETDQAITVKNSRLLELAVKVGEALRPTGPLDVDLFISGEDVYILEFNPRFGGGYPLSHAAGVNFPQLMLDIASGKQLEPNIGDYTDNLVMIKESNAQIFSLSEANRVLCT